jgi:hypothetical protein
VATWWLPPSFLLRGQICHLTVNSLIILALVLTFLPASSSSESFASGLGRAAVQTATDRVPQHPPIAAKVMRVESMRGPVEFSNPALRMKGAIEPRAGNLLLMIEIVLGDADVEAEASTFELVTADDNRYAPIAVGGGARLLFPLDRLPIGDEMTQILPIDGIIAVTKNSATSVTVEATSMATLAFLYEVPRDATVKTLKLPDGSALALDK